MAKTIGYGLILALTLLLVSCYPTSGILKYAKDGDVAGIQPYVKNGEIDKEDRGGMTSLMYAAYYGKAPMAKYLCENGAGVNKQDKKGWTSLMYATYYNFPEVVEILLHNGASTTLVNSKGEKAIDYAKKFNYLDIITMLESSSK
jgi:ankyrin repeat protein